MNDGSSEKWLRKRTLSLSQMRVYRLVEWVSVNDGLRVAHDELGYISLLNGYLSHNWKVSPLGARSRAG